MKNYKQILEAINRGIKLALDDYEEQANELIGPKKNVIKNNNATKELIQLYQYVTDLGLPSGTLWCNNNIGADCDDYPESWYGSYFAWGDQNGDKESWGEKEYKFGYKRKYNENDKLTTLELEDDVAYNTPIYKNYKFRTPTKEQCEELLRYTEQIWETNYNNIEGLNGCRYISKINNAEIFIPAAGYIFIGNDDTQENAIIQSATNAADKKRPDCCWCLQAKPKLAEMNWCFYRNCGVPIRPVLK